MRLNTKSLEKIYHKYGYKEVTRDESIKIFLYEQGRYFGADIIPLDNRDETIEKIKQIKQEYGDGGYAAQIKHYKDDDDASIELYRSFFSYETTKRRIKNKYSEFEKTQSKLNGGRYEYINSPFRINSENQNSSEIMESIISVLKRKKPQLVIIEASAGYGKTCTAYEILKKLLESDFCENPLITELSRNRGANIFRYILLDEIDREYPTLDSNLVNYEIKTGRIPLIIDGFDELLNKSDIVKSETNEVFIEIETMLDTIGSLLKGNAKIILTTRRTAIFAGEDFQKWLLKWNGEFDATRFSIDVPRIKDWLKPERLKLITESQMPVENIANPVLLTYLRNLLEVDFINHLKEPDSIVKKYFYSLLEREITRQDLKISAEEQYIIFKNVVKMMISFDITSDKRPFIRELIIDQNKEILEKTISLYSSDQSIDLLADKLINHALLDRKGRDEDMIGFINDFVFGTFIGEIMSTTDTKEIEKSFSAYMVEIGVTAYRVQNSENKKSLWNKIDILKDKFENSVLFNLDVTLTGKINRNFSETVFQSIQIYNITFQNHYTISSSVFINCKFKNCAFEFGVFESVSFVECVFEDCKIYDDKYIDDGNNIYNIKCIQKGTRVFLFESSIFDEAQNNIFEENEENEILSNIYEIEENYKSQRLMHLMKRYNKSDHKQISRTIECLVNKKIIRINGLDLFIELNKLQIVKERIGII